MPITVHTTIEISPSDLVEIITLHLASLGYAPREDLEAVVEDLTLIFTAERIEDTDPRPGPLGVDGELSQEVYDQMVGRLVSSGILRDTTKSPEAPRGEEPTFVVKEDDAYELVLVRPEDYLGVASNAKPELAMAKEEREAAALEARANKLATLRAQIDAQAPIPTDTLVSPQ